jgi:hypothetical protein
MAKCCAIIPVSTGPGLPPFIEFGPSRLETCKCGRGQLQFGKLPAELLAGKEVATPATAAVGCPINAVLVAEAPGSPVAKITCYKLRRGSSSTIGSKHADQPGPNNAQKGESTDHDD